jgi:formate-dependent nitrite reductase membrane component NrfD
MSKTAAKTTVNADDSRVNVLIRLIGVIFFVLGLVMTYETFVQAGASAQVLQPPIVPVLYLTSMMLTLAGFVALISKYKGSTPPKP